MIWIIDFGSQYTQLIIRKSRKIGFNPELMVYEEFCERLKTSKPDAIILSGGPSSVYEDTNNYDSLFKLKVPVLGICYGMQVMAHFFGGVVQKGELGEYGKSTVQSFSDLPDKIDVWMSHFDIVEKVPDLFEVVYISENKIIAGMESKEKKLLALQFHPEVNETDKGEEIFEYFYTEVASLQKNWNQQSRLDICKESFNIVKDDEFVLCGFSGGVDSLVAAQIAHQCVRNRLVCVYIDHGLMRPQDEKHIQLLSKSLDLEILKIDSSQVFLNRLVGVSDPEGKRKTMGKTFVEEFERIVKKIENKKKISFKYLLQGTLFPDVIESISPHKKNGKSVTIKSHHNVGGLPEKMNLSLIEPLRYMFKDEVREIGVEIGLEKKWVFRHPFPGPGLGVRILGALDNESILATKKSDQILYEELIRNDLYDDIWQAFTVFLPIKTVGVKGDERAYENVVCIRMVNSIDGMTAKWSKVSLSFLDKVSSRITNEVKGITRVVYDITSKPPGTIEWE